MHTLRTSTRLLLLPLLCLAGCASTSGVSSKMQTVASVGDKKYPVVTGEPGSSIVADVTPTEPSVRSKGRISGRVVDETGEPLPNVRVRLAVGNTPGGQLIRATTDRTGAFTLNGVRAGSAHTVIAEWEDGVEYLTGRSVVDAPDTNVRITLAPSGTESKTANAPIRPNRISPISDKSSTMDEDEEDEAVVDAPRLSARKSRVNEEDLPPAREAESSHRRRARERLKQHHARARARRDGFAGGASDRMESRTRIRGRRPSLGRTLLRRCKILRPAKQAHSPRMSRTRTRGRTRSLPRSSRGNRPLRGRSIRFLVLASHGARPPRVTTMTRFLRHASQGRCPSRLRSGRSRARPPSCLRSSPSLPPRRPKPIRFPRRSNRDGMGTSLQPKQTRLLHQNSNPKKDRVLQLRLT